jgi:hypothetical protein
MIENDDGGWKAGLSGLAEFPGQKKLDAQVQSAEEVRAVISRFATGISNQALLARIALARTSIDSASSGRPMARRQSA